MIWIVKALAVVATGAGAFVPLRLAGYLGSSAVKAGGVLVSELVGKAETYKETKHHKALTRLTKDGCYFAQNPQNPTWFESLYVCAGNNNVASFYFLDKEGKARVGEDLDKKVVNVNYVSENDKAHLLMKLKNGQQVKYNVVAGSGWEHFKEVTPESQCKVGTLALGGKTLECNFNDGTSYIYSIF